MLKYGWMLAQHSIARMLQGGGRSQMDLKRRTCIYLRLPACLPALPVCLHGISGYYTYIALRQSQRQSIYRTHVI